MVLRRRGELYGTANVPRVMFTVAPHATRRFRDFRSSPHGGLCGAQCWRHLENTIFNPFDSSMTECGNGFFGVDLPLKPPSVALGAVVLTLKSRAQGAWPCLQRVSSPLQLGQKVTFK